MLIGHRHEVSCVHYSSCGNFICTASIDKTIKIWNAHTFQLIGNVLGHNDGVSSVRFDDKTQYILSGSYDRTVMVWKFDTF